MNVLEEIKRLPRLPLETGVKSIVRAFRLGFGVYVKFVFFCQFKYKICLLIRTAALYLKLLRSVEVLFSISKKF